ncbi:MAG: hypothetical protein K8S00_12095 [Bacteroidales bacterium]|nr:hypothetical protein [Bacteroidales bacterium]
MGKKALEDQQFELIKAHVLNPDDSPLPESDRILMDRWTTAARILDEYPQKNKAVKFLMLKYREISQSQAYLDIANAQRLFNAMNKFDYDWWHTWLLNDIVKLIKKCRNDKDIKGWVMAQSNLIKALGDRPDENYNPRTMEQHNFFMTLNINGENVRFDLNEIFELPELKRKRIADAMITPITIDQAAEIIES